MFNIRFKRYIGSGYESREFVCDNYSFTETKETNKYMILEFSDGTHVTMCLDVYPEWVVVFLGGENETMADNDLE